MVWSRGCCSSSGRRAGSFFRGSGVPGVLPVVLGDLPLVLRSHLLSVFPAAGGVVAWGFRLQPGLGEKKARGRSDRLVVGEVVIGAWFIIRLVGLCIVVYFQKKIIGRWQSGGCVYQVFHGVVRLK
eukprot:10630901-Heterocapsa_arctica.AAC.1